MMKHVKTLFQKVNSCFGKQKIFLYFCMLFILSAFFTVTINQNDVYAAAEPAGTIYAASPIRQQIRLGQATSVVPGGRGFMLPQAVVVKDKSGNPIQGLQITFEVFDNSTISASMRGSNSKIVKIMTDANGMALATNTHASYLGEGYQVYSRVTKAVETITVTASAPGFNTITFEVEVGTVGGNIYDNTNPFIFVSAKNDDGTTYIAGTWARDPVTVTYSATDSLSEIIYLTPEQIFSKDGANQFAVGEAIDAVNLSQSISFGPINIDRTAPITYVSDTEPEFGDWNNDAVEVEFYATDNVSGVAAIYYKINDEEPVKIESNNFITTVNTEGINQIKYWAVDIAGNIEDEQTLTVKIDKSSPTLTKRLSPNENSNGWNDTAVELYLTAEDMYSGVREIYYQVGDEDEAQAIGNSAIVSIYEEGTTKVTFWAVDNLGFVSEKETVSVNIDKTNPVLTVPMDITLEATAIKTPVLLGTPTVVDISEVKITNDAPQDGFPVGVTKVKWIAEDSVGKITEGVQTITVKDTTKPLLTVQGNIVKEATGILTPVVVGPAEAKDIFSVNITNDAPQEGFPLGDTKVTFTATDANGNSVTAIQYVTIKDRTPPVLTLPADITSYEATAVRTPIDIGMATATDIFEVTIGNNAPADYVVGTTDVAWTATDANGNVSTGIQKITVVDTTKPVLNIPDDITIEATARRMKIDIGEATATDIFAVSIKNDAPADFGVGTTKVTWTATDANGNVTTKVQNITVTDTTKPEIKVKDDIIIEATGRTTPVQLALPDVSDIFETTITNNAPENNIFPLGKTTVTWTVKDSNGNVSTGVQIVNVVDTTKPLLTLPKDIMVEATAIRTPVEIGTANATDIFNVTIKNNAPADYPVGETKVIWTATDENGNITEGIQTIIVVDTTKPVISISGNTTNVEATGRRTPVTFKATATDIFKVTITDNAPADYPLGETIVTVTATDENGNIASKDVKVTVVDTTKPLMELPPDMTVEANAVRSIIDIGQPEVSDIFDCTVENDAPADYPIGITKVIWTATDENGNTSIGTQIITVKDTTKPELIVPEDIIAEATAVLSPISLGKAIANDIFDVTIKNNAPEAFGLGQTVVTWTATDANGNVTTDTQRVIVKDTTPPAIVSIEDLTIEATDILTPVDLVEPKVTEIFKVTMSNDAPEAFPLGTTKVVWTIKDENGNSTTAIQSVTIVDTTKPVLNLPADIKLEATAVRTPVNLIQATASDIFGADVTSDAPVDFPVGVTTITWTATDKNGNITTGTQKVTIEDTTKPILTVPEAIKAEATDIRTALNIGMAKATDIFPVLITNDAPADFPIGNTIVKWTATDENGNVSTAEQLITIEDTTKPVLILPEDITTEATARKTPVNIGEAKAIDIFKVNITNDAPAEYPLGKTIVIWTAIDENGNVSKAEQVITIVDTTAPELNVPNNIETEATAINTPVSIGLATATDIFNVTVTSDAPVVYPIGETIVTWTAKDENGNVSTKEQIIKIVDTTKPVLKVPDNIEAEATAIKTPINIREATATDIFKVDIVNDAPEAFPVGVTIVKWTATDANGNVSEAEQIIKIVDSTKPVLVIPASITTEATSIRTPVDIGKATATDIFPVELINDAPADYPIGETIIHWKATDANGNVSEAEQVIKIVDTTKPVLVVPGPVTAEAIAIETPVNIGGATASDIFEVVITSDAPEKYLLGETVVTWTATDANGNVSTAEQVITIVDTTKPVITAPADIKEEATAINTPVDIGQATATDIYPVTITSDKPESYTLGETIVTWKATDANGNESTATQKITIVDTTPPEIIKPKPLIIEATALKTPVNLVSPETRDIYEVTTSHNAPAGGFTLGKTEVIWTATDANGNVSTEIQEIIIVDTTKPVITAPKDIIMEATAVRTLVDLGSPTTFDIFKVTTTNDAPADFPVGTTVVVWTATDENGNVATAEQKVTIVDTTKPELTVPADVTAEATAINTPVDIGEATATDIFEVTIVNDDPKEYKLGETIVTWTATDENGNVSTKKQKITIKDTTPPELTVPENITAEAVAINTPVDIGEATATDIYPVTITCDKPDSYKLGTTPVTWTATDANGNVTKKVQLITIVDTTKPVVIPPADIEKEATAVLTPVNIGVPTTSDIYKMTVKNDAPAAFPIGTTIVKWEVIDENGNVTIVEQKITIVDTTPPELIVPKDITEEATAVRTPLKIGEATASDIFKITVTNDAPADFPIGETIVTWTATDENGNVSKAEQRITIVDTTKPELTVPDDIVTEATAIETPVDIGEAIASDIFEVTLINDAPEVYPLGTKTVKWTATDANGNVTTKEQKITIKDTTRPELIVPEDITVEATAIRTPVDIGEATATDIFKVTITNNALADYPLGKTVVTWKATDENGNVSTAEQVITVVDTTKPVLKVPGDIVAEATALLTPLDIGVGIATDIFDVALSNDAPAAYPLGITIVTWTAIDENGNIATGKQRIRIVDTTKPVLSVPKDITAEATAIRTPVDIGQAEATDIFPVTITNDAPADYQIGTTRVTWIATDANGNVTTAEQKITIVDTTAPKLIVPKDIVAEATALRTPVDIGIATATDIFPVTITNNAPADYPIGITEVIWTAIDENGNVTTAVQKIIIVDTTAPELIVPKDIAAEATALRTPVDIGIATATDIFPVTITNNAPADYPIGDTTVTWTATDANGNVTTKEQVVTIIDTTMPVLVLPNDIVKEATGIRTPVDIGNAVATDIFETTIRNNAPVDYPIGDTYVVWIAKDENLNVATGRQKITIVDTTKPELTVPADVTVTATGIRTVVAIGQATAKDIFDVTISNNAPADFPVGETLVTWTATDANGNITTAVQKVTVKPVQNTVLLKAYNSNKADTTNTLDPRIMLQNTSNTTINLSDIKIRYYYTVDGDKGQSYYCDYAQVGGSGAQRAITSSVTGTAQKSTAKPGSDYYLEISFSSNAGTLNPGEKVEIQGRLTKTDWTNYTQTNDYSFNPTATEYTENTKITVYLSGNLFYGVEP
ncbi:HYR domain-containing protein [Ruminiclostridium herbifermentans]|uniref:HYR domain-containing protein n=1 Tax=Ruminiclostridium herbifermentans TaxID=2488810 RepID=A0A4V6EPC0_9FIRM|nr:HYR domain-containing protein [Ruminiclostridium herbifermentans]QNU65822.1 HYR domain-containing protein [Ruminiclostridium herbifermentans]